MPVINNLSLFLAAALVVAITPGPGIFYVAARTLAGGRGEGVASSIGLGLGGLVHVIAGAIGISALVMASAEAFAIVKIFGAAYLVWLGLKAWREASVPLPTDVRTTGSRQALREGIIVEALNPKTSSILSRIYPAVRRCFAARSRAVCRPRSYLSCAEHKRRYCGHLCSSNSSRGS